MIFFIFRKIEMSYFIVNILLFRPCIMLYHVFCVLPSYFVLKDEAIKLVNHLA
jgi:hypothetical protein